MTDIVERLRAGTGDGLRAYDWMNEAADEIERLRAERDMWRQENLKKQIACEQMGARIVALEAERDEAIERGNDWCDQTKKARVERDVARREGIKAAAREVDCSCEVRDAVLDRLKARDLTRASWLCQHGDVCCALQAAEILDLLEDAPRAVAEAQPAARRPECVERWSDCADGDYDPRCCRFPKSCSCALLEDGR